MGKKKEALLRQTDADIEERYEFCWPGKRKCMEEAQRSCNAVMEEDESSGLFSDKTGNLYIEGDNLTSLKLLEAEYEGKIKMIYIDPPYNTGSDHIYMDRFTGGDNTAKAGSSSRSHAAWCSMIYPRLYVARRLLSEDGVIFISIDDNEEFNLKKICEEIFGEANRVGEIIRKTKSMTADDGSGFNLQHELLLIYAKDKSKLRLKGEKKAFANYSNPDNDPKGDWCAGDPSARSGGATTYFEIENPYTHKKDLPPSGRYWAFSKESLKRYIEEGKIKFKEKYREGERGFIFKRYRADAKSQYEPVHSLFAVENEFMNQAATTELRKIFGSDVFSYPKPVAYIQKLVQFCTGEGDMVLDFFSGSATTAQAVMEQVAEDGLKRNFIMVQLPEEVDKKRDAYKAGFRTLCDVGRERIRLVAQRLKDKADCGFRSYVIKENEKK